MSRGVHHHLAYLRWAAGNKTSHYVHFRWPGQKAPNFIYQK